MLNGIELEKLIIDLKKKYYTVFATTVGHRLFIWRPITKDEYNTICKTCAGDELLKEELICQLSVLYPEVSFATYKAGIPGTLTPQILEESGLGSQEKVYRHLDFSRGKIIEDFATQAEIVIAAAFPQYKFEEMKKWNIEQLLDMVAKAEWKLNVLDEKDFVFKTVTEESEEVQETKSPKEELREIEQNIIQNGGDPILQLGHIYQLDNRKDYIEYPFIMGYNWDNEEVVHVIQQQLQRVSNG